MNFRNGNPSPLPFHFNAMLSSLADNADIKTLGGLSDYCVQLGTIINSLGKWQNHPHRRPQSEPPVIWRRGSSRLLDYGNNNNANHPAVLVIPSMINQPYILDLSPDISLLKGLCAQGLHPYLLDWGSPGNVEFDFDINHYIVDRALPALNHITRKNGQKVGILGYCMGGTIAAAMAQIDHKITSLVTLAAPWDFGCATGNLKYLIETASIENGLHLENTVTYLSRVFGAVPVEFFQFLFASIDTGQFAKKFRKFSAMSYASSEAKRFVDIEDWLADGVPMAGPAATDLLVNWHVKNAIIEGHWQVKNIQIDAKKIKVPGFIICGKSDKIAPPASTMALAERMPNAQTLRPGTGHVGMVTGSEFGSNILPPISDFLKANAIV